MELEWAESPFRELDTHEDMNGLNHSMQWVDEIHLLHDQDLEFADRSISCHDIEFSEEYFLTGLIGQSSIPPTDVDPEIDVGRLHAEAIAEETYLQTQVWRADRSRATAEAVTRLKSEKRLDDFEAQSDEILEGVMGGVDKTKALNPPYPP